MSEFSPTSPEPPDKPPPKRPPGSFFIVDRAALEVMPRLSPPAVLVYLQLCSMAGAGSMCYPSLAELVERTQAGRRSIIRYLKELESSGLVEIESGRGSRSTSRYTINRVVPPVAPLDESSSANPGTRVVPNSALSGAKSCCSVVPPVAHGMRLNNETQERDSFNETNTPPAKPASLFGEEVDVSESGKKRTRETYPEEFSQWYDIYPKHVAKGDAEKAFPKAFSLIAAKHNTPAEAILWLLDRTREFASSDKGQSGQYCPNPATWLNGKRYDDKPEAWKLNGNGKPKVETKGFLHSTEGVRCGTWS